MTVAPDAPPLVFGDIEEAVAILRRRGFRLTAPRRLVLEALFAADGPVSADYITRELRLDLTSVYRNLETLERQGLVRHVHLGHGPGLYALLGGGECEYLYCEHCGAVKALPPEQLDPVRDQVRERFGYAARFTHFAIVGACPTCAQQHRHAASCPRSHERQRPHEQYGQAHAHAHSHGDHIHSHPHAHEQGDHDQHRHGH